MHLPNVDGQKLPEKNIRTVAGPDRHASRVEVPRVPFEKLSDRRTGEPSATVRKRVEAARAIRRQRFKGTTRQINANTGLGGWFEN